MLIILHYIKVINLGNFFHNMRINPLKLYCDSLLYRLPLQSIDIAFSFRAYRNIFPNKEVLVIKFKSISVGTDAYIFILEGHTTICKVCNHCNSLLEN